MTFASVMYDFGSIVLIPFPFTDLQSVKVRPALIVSRAQRQSKDLILCFITSQADADLPHSQIVDAGKRTGLKVTSLVRFDRIATLEKSLVLGELGRVDAAWLKKARRTFHQVFGF